MAETAVSAALSTPSVAVPAPLPVRAVLPWALFVGLLALIALYFVGAEQGATSLFAGSDVHEWVHDGRHLLGFPCH
ncbi:MULTISPECIES: CbtB domain-containing protein [unclassified Streptomyces]|uniref:CbtB domain-containing protein n=1 Tax=unclassified Streptomyces TaxID=2593676 RepID=UPI0016615857|nr:MULTISPECIES: CbtB-domain containing protein [unclassified Streptomyces]MBD0707812.1 cobalt transporter [Streptomyces sp. CBMA291]MBD0713956.1 cobalt transporter [Streptomyces sp. CBMA370]